MERDTVFEAAALAAIRQRRSEMATPARATDADKQLKRAIRATWALGDYHRFATQLVWEVGQVVVDACGISAGQRVLDVAGSGNVAIRAAKAGAQVVAS
jgi:2-polyprenyl-3-methyl-5-hydroxy-6-metoxy-1,4-benzoquinol methylase